METFKVAALYVITDGPYFGLADVDPWDEKRDARAYPGPHPVVAHPPCARWGSYWHGCKPEGHPGRGVRGDDGGCFEAAMTSVRRHGGILEHPAHSYAFKYFELETPEPGQQWCFAGPVQRDAFYDLESWVVEVEQGHYGHRARKKTWLYAVGKRPPDIILGPSDKTGQIDRLKPRHYKCRGVVERLSHRERAATPVPFRDYLLDYARTCRAG